MTPDRQPFAKLGGMVNPHVDAQGRSQDNQGNKGMRAASDTSVCMPRRRRMGSREKGREADPRPRWR